MKEAIDVYGKRIRIKLEADTMRELRERVNAFRLLFGKRPDVFVMSNVESATGDTVRCSLHPAGCKVTAMTLSIVKFTFEDSETEFRFEKQDGVIFVLEG